LNHVDDLPSYSSNASLWVWSIGDELRVPEAHGDFVLQWRWDTEESVQVWTSCADIRIVKNKSSSVFTSSMAV